MRTTYNTLQYVPLRHRLGAALADRIYRGEWKPDKPIPTETELAREFEVSQGTIRQALMELVARGLVYRKQGKGTFVNRLRFDRSLTRFFRLSDAEGNIVNPDAQVLQVEVVPAAINVRQILRLADDAVYRVVRLRTYQGEPLIVQTSFFSKTRFPGLERLDLSGPMYQVLEKEYGVYVLRAEEYLEPSLARDKEASLLRIRSGSPVILIDRVARSYEDTPVELRHSVGRGDKYRYYVELR